MTNPYLVRMARKGHCLNDADFYNYLTRSTAERSLGDIESHLVSCGRCREELATLLKVLHPEPEETREIAQEPSPEEIEATLALIQKVSPNRITAEPPKYQWYRWAAIASAILIIIGLGSAGLTYLYEKRKSDAFYLQAKLLLQQVYEPRSPSDLRLDLPFNSSVSQREPASKEKSQDAQNLLYQTLAVRNGMREALLGLGYLHLYNRQFAKAEGEFQKVLNRNSTDPQALLGRGASRFEEAMTAPDPVERNARLESALQDFNRLLQLKPESAEARYDKARTLYEMGRHNQALQEIEAYLLRDRDSIWAIKLRDLQTRIRMNRSEVIEKEVRRAAEARDADTLEALVRVARHKIPSTIRSLLLQSLEIEGQPARVGTPDSSALQWAAGVLATAYDRATGENSYSRLQRYYGGLSPPQKQAKKTLDTQLEQTIGLFAKNDIQSALQASRSLVRKFEGLHDYWQLVRLHQLRGSAFFYGKSDFNAANTEFRKMLGCAEGSGDPDLIARALSALASSCNEQGHYDEALSYLSRLRELAESLHMDPWLAFAAHSLGTTYLRLNQLEESRRAYGSSLELAFRLMDQQALVVSLEYLGTVMEKMRRFADARHFYCQSREWQNAFLHDGTLQSTPEAEARRLSLLNKEGYLALHLNDPRAAEVLFKEALRHPSDRMRALNARNHLGLAQVYLETKRIPEAKAEVRNALESTSSNEFPEVSWEACSLEGTLNEQAGEDAAALLCFERAIQSLEQMRLHIPSVELRRSFLSQRFDPFRKAVSLSFRSQGSPEKALAYVSRAKCLTLREYLISHSLQPAASEHQPSWMEGMDQLPSLPSGMAALEYFLASDQVFTFLSTDQGVEAVSLRVPIAELEEQVQRYLRSIQSNDRNSFSTLSAALYKELLEPIMVKLESGSIDTISIIPDGFLHLLPFGSLKDSKGHYLVERFALSHAPSRSILQYCLAMNKAKSNASESTALLMDGSSNLVGASQELANLARLYPSTRRLVSAGDLPFLGSTIGEYEIIHFSGHADIFRGKPRLVFRGAQGETYLDSSMIEKWKLRKNRLVSLAGCSTGVGPVAEGEIPWGLLPSLLNAGAPSILVSLMPVDDLAAADLTMRFYALWAQDSFSRAHALRQAQLSFIHNGGSKADSLPFSWAPFVLWGDPR